MSSVVSSLTSMLGSLTSGYVTENHVNIMIILLIVNVILRIIIYFFFNNFQFEDIAFRKRQERDAVDHKLFYNSRNEEIDKKIFAIHDATELLQKFRSGEVTRADAVLALSRRSHEIGIELESVTEEVYDDAFREAKDMDEVNSSLPMCGIPVSIKDSFHMKGCDSTVGTAARCFKPESEDGLLVQLLRRAGCIPYVR